MSHTTPKGRRPKLPNAKIEFERLSQRTAWVRVKDFRPPKKGEYFLSGAVVSAYLAASDFATPYWIAEPILDVEAPESQHLHQYDY